MGKEEIKSEELMAAGQSCDTQAVCRDRPLTQRSPPGLGRQYGRRLAIRLLTLSLLHPQEQEGH